MVDYEWDIESVCDDGDIEDHDRRARLSEFDPSDLAKALSGGRKELVLVRTADDGDRCWAYVKNGALPSMLSDPWGNPCHKVPSKYVREFEKLKR